MLFQVGTRFQLSADAIFAKINRLAQRERFLVVKQTEKRNKNPLLMRMRIKCSRRLNQQGKGAGDAESAGDGRERSRRKVRSSAKSQCLRRAVWSWCPVATDDGHFRRLPVCVLFSWPFSLLLNPLTTAVSTLLMHSRHSTCVIHIHMPLHV